MTTPQKPNSLAGLISAAKAAGKVVPISKTEQNKKDNDFWVNALKAKLGGENAQSKEKAPAALPVAENNQGERGGATATSLPLCVRAEGNSEVPAFGPMLANGRNSFGANFPRHSEDLPQTNVPAADGEAGNGVANATLEQEPVASVSTATKKPDPFAALKVKAPSASSVGAFTKLAASLAQAKPDAAIKRLEVAQNKTLQTAQPVTAPILSLKGMLATQQKAFADKFTAETAVTAPTSEEEFDQSQEDAVIGMMRNQFSCLIGQAGTGKTTTLKKFLKRIRDKIRTIERTKVLEGGTEEKSYHLAIGFFAFTGRAVEQMKRALPEEYHGVCGTIHGDKCLNYLPEFYEDVDENGLMKEKMRFVPSYGPMNKLPYDYYVIDEAGMLSVELWNILRGAMHKHARVILVGDINQLPPVYGRSILGYALTKWPVFELTTIHRQAANNPIIANASAILQGLPPTACVGKFDMEDLKDRGSSKTQTRILDLIKFAHKQGIFDPMRDGFIVPQNKGPIGQLQLNELLVTYFNPGDTAETKRQVIKTGMAMAVFAKGDKIMMLANDKNKGLTNGQIGEIISININGNYKNDRGLSQHELQQMHKVEIGEEHLADFMLNMDKLEGEEKKEEDMNQRQASHIVVAKFGEKEFSFSTAGEFRKIAHAYCITCHKSQGGEYPVVVVLIHSANAVLLSREWLYTAVTRARERIILVYNQRGLQQALKNQRIQGRTLKEKIASFLKISEQDAGKDTAIVPDLPAACELNVAT